MPRHVCQCAVIAISHPLTVPSYQKKTSDTRRVAKKRGRAHSHYSRLLPLAFRLFPLPSSLSNPLFHWPPTFFVILLSYKFTEGEIRKDILCWKENQKNFIVVKSAEITGPVKQNGTGVNTAKRTYVVLFAPSTQSAGKIYWHRKKYPKQVLEKNRTLSLPA